MDDDGYIRGTTTGSLEKGNHDDGFTFEGNHVRLTAPSEGLGEGTSESSAEGGDIAEYTDTDTDGDDSDGDGDGDGDGNSNGDGDSGGDGNGNSNGDGDGDGDGDGGTFNSEP